MRVQAFIVEDSFLIKGCGTGPAPGIIPQGKERFRVGDPVSLSALMVRRSRGTSAVWG